MSSRGPLRFIAHEVVCVECVSSVYSFKVTGRIRRVKRAAYPIARAAALSAALYTRGRDGGRAGGSYAYAPMIAA